MTLFTYLFHSSLYLLLFYGCYRLWLHRTTFFGLNRAFLLLSLALSLLLPAIELPTELVRTLPRATITLPTVTVGSQSAAESTTFPMLLWVFALYDLGVVMLLGRLGYQLLGIHRLIASGRHERTAAYTLVYLPDNSVPSFSFSRYLVLNAADAEADSTALLRHEEAHIRQRHTLDVLAVSLIQAFLWFNPVLLFYKRSLQEIHEFLADRSAQRTPSPDYARQLVAYALNVSPVALVATFSTPSTLKQRLLMLQKPSSSRRSLLGYALVLPLAATLFMCTQTDNDVAVPASSTARKAVKVDGEVFTVVETQPEFPGGLKELGNYMSENLRYPAAAMKVKAEGRVFVSFIVTKNGEITDVKILKDVGFGTAEESKRVIEQMPRWTPGKQNGHPVNVRFQMPINFTLE